MSNALANALKGAMKLGGNKAAKPEDDEVDTNSVDENEEDDPAAEGDDDDVDDDIDNDASADGDDDADDDVSAEGEDGEDDDEESQPKPDAKTRRAVNAAVSQERKRCVAILTHANANSQPELAAALLVDGTSKKKATKLLGSIQASKAGGNLASRMNASQGGKRPGVDGGGGKKVDADSQLVAAAGKYFSKTSNK